MDIRSLRANRSAWRTVCGALIVLAVTAGPGRALDEPSGELAALKACEKTLCSMIMDKKPVGADFKCDAQKTWAKSTLEGGESKGVSWGFGDAQCKTNIKLARADIIAALTKPKHNVRLPAQQVNCVLERDGEIKPVVIKLAPKLTFKDGKADKVWINLESIEGPADVKSTIWTAAKLEDSIGIFHRPMIKSINKFLFTQCPKRYGPGAVAAAAKAATAAQVKAAAAAKAAKIKATGAAPAAKASGANAAAPLPAAAVVKAPPKSAATASSPLPKATAATP
jgi:hypothetical protein